MNALGKIMWNVVTSGKGRQLTPDEVESSLSELHVDLQPEIERLRIDRISALSCLKLTLD